ncbi:MAG TPA: NAD(P)H-hydrate dehydratase [Gemmatimonadaceae bacterium]|nr:NAD(P)H-hydrate dehydratase [Gemmatimonadaceae bacterium]
MEGRDDRLTHRDAPAPGAARVTTAAQAAAIDARAIAAGTPSWSLMQAAGHAAASLIADRYAGELGAGVLVVAGAGNNGGDGYVVASRLASLGVQVSVLATGHPNTADAVRAREALPGQVSVHSWAGRQAGRFEAALIVDAVLGTGASGAPHGAAAEAIETMTIAARAGVPVVALDVPSGLDATTGATPGACVPAATTITFGTVKRGLLRNRGAAGEIAVVDIGLGAAADDPEAPVLVDGAAALAAVPAIAADAHKGSRRRLLVVGGADGMTGAPILAARAALRSGAGMVRLCVAPPSVAPAQAAVPAALAAPWPEDDAALAALLAWADGVLLGPGLGLSQASRSLAMRVLDAWRGPIVADADALSLFEGEADALGRHLAARPAVVTPHVREAQRLAGVPAADLDAGRFEAAAFIASRVQATVLLKGVPTVVSNGRATVVVASGTPALATGGSGDVLGGIVATLLAQTGDPQSSAATGAWVHGCAAEIAGGGRARGIVLDDIVDALRHAWTPPRRPSPPVLAELARVGES